MSIRIWQILTSHRLFVFFSLICVDRSHFCFDTSELMGFIHSCTTTWTSASSLFPVCHYWPNWL